MKRGRGVLALGVLLFGACTCAKEPASTPGDTSQVPAVEGAATPMNRLAGAPSALLEAWAAQPTPWQPWGEAAFAEARQRDVLVLVLIAARTDHHAHRMARELFEDPDRAAWLTERVVPVLVDRHQRPDLAATFTHLSRVFEQRPDWPVTAILTPAGDPLYVTSYLQPETGTHDESQGMKELLVRLSTRYHEQPQPTVLEAVKRWPLAQRMGKSAAIRALPGPEVVARALARHQSRFDAEHGGFGPAPRHPNPGLLELLLEVTEAQEDPALEGALEKTLRGMHEGGLWDHLGGGFFQQSEVEDWGLSNWVKTSAGNARLMTVYAEAWARDGDADHQAVVEATAAWLLREVRGPEGTFYTAIGSGARPGIGRRPEGAFYTFTREELVAALGEDDGVLAGQLWSVQNAGPEGRRSILRRLDSFETLGARTFGRYPDLAAEERRLRPKLLAARRARPAPPVDQSVVTAHNALVVSALARAGKRFERPAWIEAATAAARKLLSRRHEDGRLLRAVFEGRGVGPGFLEDHVFMTAALLDLFEVTGEARWLEEARNLQTLVQQRFRDPATGALRRDAMPDPQLKASSLEVRDPDLPAIPGVLAENLLRLSRHTGDAGYRTGAERLLLRYGAELTATEPPPTLLLALRHLGRT